MSKPKMVLWGGRDALQELHLAGMHDQASHAGSGGSALEKTEREGGATISPKTGRSVRKGYAVATGAPSKVVRKADFTPEVFREWVNKTKFGPNERVGLWDDGEGNIWLDKTEVVADRASAVRLGRERNEKAIYHLEKGGEGEIDTGGSGNVS